MIVSIPYETPSKKNSRVVNRRTGRSFPNRKYTDWHDRAALWLRTHYELGPLGDGPFSVRLHFVHGDNIRRDSDNGVSSILDLLVDLGILPDDCWKVVRSISVHNDYERGNPSVQVAVFPVRRDSTSEPPQVVKKVCKI